MTEPLDDSPEGQLIRFVRGYAAKVEHEKIRERSVRGRLARALGSATQPPKLIPAARPLCGYQWRDGTHGAYDLDPVTAPIVRRTFSEALTGATLRGIAAARTADGIPPPAGRAVAQGEFWLGQRSRQSVCGAGADGGNILSPARPAAAGLPGGRG